MLTFPVVLVRKSFKLFEIKILWTERQRTSYVLRGDNVGCNAESNFINIMFTVYVNMIHLAL